MIAVDSCGDKAHLATQDSEARCAEPTSNRLMRERTGDGSWTERWTARFERDHVP